MEKNTLELLVKGAVKVICSKKFNRYRLGHSQLIVKGKGNLRMNV